MKRARALEIAGVCAVFAAAIAAIHPRGNFPLNDDGLYALPTFEFAATGKFHMTMMSPSLRAQIVWGALWVRAFGATYDTLRLCTIVTAVATVAMFNALVAQTPMPRIGRIIVTLAFAFHPIFLWSSCTFMTEVHFVFCCVTAVYFYVRGFREQRAGFLIAGCVAVAISWWIRQTGLITAFPAIVFLLLYRQHLSRRWVRDLAICIAPVVLFAIVHRFWPDTLVGNAIELETLTHQWRESTWRLPQITAWTYHTSAWSLETTALMFLPIIVGLRLRASARRDKLVIAAMAVLMAIGTVVWLSDHIPLPHYGLVGINNYTGGDIFMNFGLGPPTLPNGFNGKIPYPIYIPYAARVVLTLIVDVAAVVLLAALVFAVLDRWRAPRENAMLFLCILFAGAHTASLTISGAYFDRYALTSQWTLGAAAAVLVPWDRVSARAASIALLVCLAAFDIAATREYFAWQTARWTAWSELRRAGVPVRDIQGGSETYGVYELAYVNDLHVRRRMAITSRDYHYAIEFGPREKYHVIARHPFTGWFGLHRGEVLTLEKD